MPLEPEWHDTGIGEGYIGESIHAYAWCGCLRILHRVGIKKEYLYYSPDGGRFRYEHELLEHLEAMRKSGGRG